MTYEPKRGGGIFDVREYFASAQRAAQTNASASRADKVKAVFEAYWAKHGKPEERAPEQKAPTPEPSPMMQKAKRMAAGIARAKAAGAIEANGVHKLAPYVIGG